MTAAENFRKTSARFRKRLANLAAFGTGFDILAIWAGGWLAAGLAVIFLPAGSLGLVLLISFLTVVAWVITVLVGGEMLIKRRWRNLPQMVEAHHPEARGILTTAATLTASREKVDRLGYSPDLKEALLRQGAGILATLSPTILIPTRRLMGKALRAVIPLVIGVILTTADPVTIREAAGLFFRPVSSWPPPVTLGLSPARAVVLEGGSLEIKALLSGRGPKDVVLETRTRDAAPRRLSMTPAEGGWFTARLVNLTARTEYRAMAGELTSSLGVVEIEPVPGVANIQVTVDPPKYTGLSPITRAGGPVEALKGSLITVTARPVKPLSAGEIIFSWEESVSLEIGDETVAASWLMDREGWYRIVVSDLSGFSSPPGLEYPVVMFPDRPPVVFLTSPSRDLELESPRPIEIAARGEDDYGLSGMAIGLRLPDGRERFVSFFEPADLPQTRFDGQKTVHLEDLGLNPGDQVTVWVEARDNDAVSGPKLSVSQPIMIRITDPAVRLKEQREMEERIRDNLISSLADSLELGEELSVIPDHPEGERLVEKLSQSLSERLKTISSDITSLAETTIMSPDVPLSDLEELDAMAAQVESLARRAERIAPSEQGRYDPNRAVEEIEELSEALEQASLLAEEIPKRRTLRKAVETGQDLMTYQNRLMDALQDLEDRPTDEAMKLLEDVAKKVSDLLEKLGEILSETAENLPEEFVNREAVETFDLGAIQQALSEILSLARAGDLAGAKAKAEELLRDLSNLVTSLQEGRDKMDQRLPDQVAGELTDQEDVLQQLIKEQGEILKETQDIQNRLTQDWPREVDRRLREQLPQLQEKAASAAKAMADLENSLKNLPLLKDSVGQVAKNLREESKALIQDLARRRSQTVPQRLESLSRGLKDLETLSSAEVSPPNLESERRQVVDQLRAAAEAGSEYRQSVESLAVNPLELLTAGEKESLGGLQVRQETLRERTSEVADRLGRLATILPMIDSQTVRGVREASREMGLAAEALGNKDPLEATPPERRALQNLMEGRSGLMSSVNRLRRMVRMAGGKLGEGRGGHQPGLFPALQIGMRPGVGKDEGGRAGLSTREFGLPEADQFRPTPKIRDTLLKSPGGEIPPAYRDQIEEYYERLSGR